MNRLLLLACFCIVSIWYLHGEIVEAKRFKEITNYITPETLVIFDIDDTLLVPVQTLGTDVWFLSRLEHYKKTKGDPALALDKALADWEAIRHLTDVKIVEEGTAEIIAEMQKNKVAVMGLTTQGLALSTRTIVQLNSLQIDLSKTAPSSQDHYFINGSKGVLYRQGILSTSGTAKGEALLKFFSLIGYCPKSIVFINDKKPHLHDVEKSVLGKGINFMGLRYSYSDQRIANYNKDIAEVQWTHSNFGHLLSDEEASNLLLKNKGVGKGQGR